MGYLYKYFHEDIVDMDVIISVKNLIIPQFIGAHRNAIAHIDVENEFISSVLLGSKRGKVVQQNQT